MSGFTPEEMNAIAQRRKARGLAVPDVPPPLGTLPEQQRDAILNRLSETIEDQLPYGPSKRGRAVFLLLILGDREANHVTNAPTRAETLRLGWLMAHAIAGVAGVNPLLESLVGLWRAVEFYERDKTAENERPLEDAMERAAGVIRAMGIDPHGVKEHGPTEPPATPDHGA